MLAKLQTEQPLEDTEIITLAFHVDYWNYLGWKDEFSSPEFSRRQNDYSIAKNLNSNYTPQMIVDGTTEFVGSKEALAKDAIAKAAENEKAKINILFDDKNSIIVLEIDKIILFEDSEVFLVIAEDNLKTNVKRGENSGRKLEHIAVVRAFEKVGEITKGDSNFSKKLKFDLPQLWQKENIRLVAFVQGKESKKVFALGQIKFNEEQ